MRVLCHQLARMCRLAKCGLHTGSTQSTHEVPCRGCYVLVVLFWQGLMGGPTWTSQRHAEAPCLFTGVVGLLGKSPLDDEGSESTPITSAASYSDNTSPILCLTPLRLTLVGSRPSRTPSSSAWPLQGCSVSARHRRVGSAWPAPCFAEFSALLAESERMQLRVKPIYNPSGGRAADTGQLVTLQHSHTRRDPPSARSLKQGRSPEMLLDSLSLLASPAHPPVHAPLEKPRPC